MGLVGGADELDPAALAPAPGVDLGLDHGERRAVPIGELFVGLARVGRGLDDQSGGHGHAKLFEQFAGLVFVDVHGGPWTGGVGRESWTNVAGQMPAVAGQA